jgi:hypothetical protein
MANNDTCLEANPVAQKKGEKMIRLIWLVDLAIAMLVVWLIYLAVKRIVKEIKKEAKK